jgi:hypothetical protein
VPPAFFDTGPALTVSASPQPALSQPHNGQYGRIQLTAHGEAAAEGVVPGRPYRHVLIVSR